jgi:hypothetical protein
MIIFNNNSIDIIQGSSYGDAGGITDWRLDNTTGGIFNILNNLSATARVSIINNGNIGFGTTPISSSSKLEIIGDINISGNYKKNNNDVIMDTSNYVLSTSNILSANILNSKSQWITTNNMIYYNTSNVGIGTTFPTSKLHLYDDIISDTKLTIQNSRLPTQIVPGTGSTISDTIGATDRYISFLYSGSASTMQYTITTTEELMCDILIVGGGGGGGSGAAVTTQIAGGGGAGGVVYMINKTLSIGTYKINVGKGGTAATSGATNGTDSSITDNNNVNLTFDSISLVGKGGGRGANVNATTAATRADAGGSGGGGGHSTTTPTTGGASTQGNTFWNGTAYVAGGFNGKTPEATNRGGGGGGAEELGDADGIGYGGDGRAVNITGTSTFYAGGGNAYPYYGTTTTGSDGGGGALTGSGSQNGGAAALNSGSGGAGAYGASSATTRIGGAGANGIVIIRYRKTTSSFSSSSSIELIRGTQNDSNRDYKIGNYNEDFIVKTSINGTDTNYITITGATGAITNPNGTANWTTTSDRRIKENIEWASYDKCYENINKLELNRFNYIKGFNTVNRDIKQLGFIAQEVKEIFPKSVFENNYINDTINIPDLHSIDITQINYSLYGTVKKLIEINNDNKKNIKKIECILNIDNNTNNNTDDTTSTSNIIIDTTLSTNNIIL